MFPDKATPHEEKASETFSIGLGDGNAYNCTTESNDLSFILPESGASEISFALFERSKKKKAYITETTIPTKIRV